MDKKQQFRTEFLMLCDEYEIDASEMSIEFLDKAYDIAIPLGAEVKHDFAESDEIKAILKFINLVGLEETAKFIMFQKQAVDGLQKNNQTFIDAHKKQNSV